ncbi:MAG: phosphomannomutase/phosphoglucomutase [Candidatus Woesearchaeota archaeon]
MLEPSIFKAYDIRGVFGKDFDEQFAYKLGLAFPGLLREKEKKALTVVVGSDMRLSSPVLKRHLIDGLLDAGVDVVDIGLSPTPTFYFAVAHYKYDGGILVSASHNPKEYNGFKLVRARALPVSRDSGMFALRDVVLAGQFKKSPIKGNLSRKDDVVKDQVVHELSFVNAKKIQPFKIVIDSANSMGAVYFDELFKSIPCKLVRMNWDLDGTFPSHEPDPLKVENLKSLAERVVKEKADLGIATDGDADRIFYVDNAGIPVEPGIIRAILSKLFLADKPGAKIVYDIRPGKITPETILNSGGIPIITAVGHSLIKERTIKEKAYFAGESSGHFFLNMDEGCYEVPMLVTLKILQDLSSFGHSFASYVLPYKKYFHSGEINFVVSDKDAKIREIRERYSDAKQLDIDGITIEYKDYWFNVRASNTEPLLRLNLEAISKDLMQQKTEELKKLIQS